MAVQIIMQGPIDGYMIHNKDPRDIAVRIIHNLDESYRPAADGSTIKEQLPLKEFLDRLVRTEYMDKRGADYRQKAEEDMFEILKSLTEYSYQSSRIQDIERWF